MALKLVRYVGVVTSATLGDDAAHSIDLGGLGSGNAFRVTEIGGRAVLIKITNEGTACTATNGMVIAANKDALVLPEEKSTSVSAISATNADPVVFTVNNGHGFKVGDQVGMTDCATAGWNTLITNGNITVVTNYDHGRDSITVDKNSTSTGAFPGGTLRLNYTLSAINQSAGADASIIVEEVCGEAP